MQKNLSENTCRVCLFEQEILINLFDEVEDFQAKLCDLLECCGDLKVDLGDNYPKLICRDCTSELLVAAKFREKCKRTKEILSQILPAEITSESENADDEPPPSESAASAEPDECYMIAEVKTEVDEESIITEQCEEEEKIDAEVEVAPEVFEHVEFLETTDSVGQYIIFEGQGERDIEAIESETTERDEKEAVDTQDQDLYERIIRAAKSAAGSSILITKPLIINCKCDICGAGFTHINNLKRHLLKHSPRELYTCLVCSCPFSNYEKLEEHQRQHDEQQNTDQLKDDTSSDVDAETLIESPPSNVKKKFITTEVEGREPKEKEAKRNHSCNQCDKRFVSKSALGAHLRIHTGDRPFQCTECSKSFTTQGGLVLHMRRHSGFRPFQCSVCGKRFVESSNLKVHMRIHTGEKPHKCTICGRSFARVFLLQIHQRTHTGERPYQCPYCDKAFAQQGDLSSHKRIHTGERPHRCPYCGKGFIKSSALTQHMRKHSKFDGTVGESKKESRKDDELRILIVQHGETAHSEAENEDGFIEESPEDILELLAK